MTDYCHLPVEKQQVLCFLLPACNCMVPSQTELIFELSDMDQNCYICKNCEILFIAVFCSYIIAKEDFKIEIMIKHAVLFVG